MNFYTLASKLNKQITKQSINNEIMYRSIGIEKTTTEIYEEAKTLALNEFEHNAKLGIELMLKFKNIATDMGLYADKLKQTYFITIRPNPLDISFQNFFDLTQKFIERKCFLSYSLVFEQKAIEPPYGTGFHCHIIATMTQRSKTEVLRDTQSTYKHCASANCIQVDIIKTSKDLERLNRYILEWKSEDGHKEKTKDADIAWRQQMHILPVYNNTTRITTCQLSSPMLAGGDNNNNNRLIVDLS